MSIKDFQVTQLRASRLIVSRSDPSVPGFLIYSASSAGVDYAGNVSSAVLSNVGTDVFMFVSGSISTGSASNPAKRIRKDIALFGGDVVVSGTLFAERQVIQVDGNITGNLHVSGSGIFMGKVVVNDSGYDQYLEIKSGTFPDGNPTAPDDGAIIYVKDQAGTKTLYFQNSDGAQKKLGSAGDTDVGWLSPSSGQIDTTGSVAVTGTLAVAERIEHIGDSHTLFYFNTDKINTEVGGVRWVDYDGNAAQKHTTWNENAADVDFRIETTGEAEALFIDAGTNALYINKGETAFTTIVGNTNDEAIRVDATGVVFNEDGHATNDFRVETDTQTHTLFVEASSNNVGVGTAAPKAELQIGDGTGDETVRIDADGAASGSLAFAKDSGLTAAALVLDADESLVLINSGSNKNIHIKANDGGTIYTAVSVQAVNSFVGINTPSPGFSFHVSGTSSSTISLVETDGTLDSSVTIGAQTSRQWYDKSQAVSAELRMRNSVSVYTGSDTASRTNRLANEDLATATPKFTGAIQRTLAYFNGENWPIDYHITAYDRGIHLPMMSVVSGSLTGASWRKNQGAGSQVLIMSGSGHGNSADSIDPQKFADTNFFVSGTVSGRGSTTHRGISVFWRGSSCIGQPNC